MKSTKISQHLQTHCTSRPRRRRPPPGRGYVSTNHKQQQITNDRSQQTIFSMKGQGQIAAVSARITSNKLRRRGHGRARVRRRRRGHDAVRPQRRRHERHGHSGGAGKGVAAARARAGVGTARRGAAVAWAQIGRRRTGAGEDQTASKSCVGLLQNTWVWYIISVR
jgi:hypothetical protein